MIAQFASRAVRSRGTLVAARAAASSSPRWTRAYARKDAPNRGAPKPPPYASEEGGVQKSPQDISKRGPVKNQTWSPDAGVKFASDGFEYSSSSTNEAAENASEDLKAAISPKPASSPSPSPSASAAAAAAAAPPPKFSSQTSAASSTSPQGAPSNAPRRSSKLGGAMAGATATSNAAPSSTGSAAEASGVEPGSSQSPLPDLTKGIPSTFEAEFLDANRSSVKDGEQAQNAELDITEAPSAEGQGGGDRQGGGSRPKDDYVSSIDRRRNALFRYTLIGFGAFAVVGTFFLGQNWESAAEEAGHSDIPNGYSPGLVYARVKARMNEFTGYYTEPAFEKLLPDHDPTMQHPYTLVLSLEDLLVTSKWTPQKGWQVAKRPGVDYFIRYLSQYYELVLFTSVPNMNGEPIRAKLEPYGFIPYALYREATKYVNGEHVKDLSYLNRDLSKTIIVDTVAAHTKLQPENAVHLPKWNGDTKDERTNDLVALIPFLEYVATMGSGDVRAVLKSFEGTHIPTEFSKREARAREAFNKQLAQERGKRGKLGSLTGSVSGMLGFKPSNSLMQIPGEPSLAEGLAQGKMLSDQIRERGQRGYMLLEKDIQENGDKFLQEAAAEQKAQIEEMTKSMQGNVRGTFGGLFGGGGSSDKKE